MSHIQDSPYSSMSLPVAAATPREDVAAEAFRDADTALMHLVDEAYAVRYSARMPLTREAALAFVDAARQRLYVIALAAPFLPSEGPR